jgi:hypothetical protein
VTIGTPKLSPKQLAILTHLHTRGHAMYMCHVASELGLKYIGVDTSRKLHFHGYIRHTDQGWLITDSGKLRVEEGV